MHKTIENIIKKNLPEKKDGSLKIPQGNPIDGYSSKTEREKGFNLALSQINTSLIADEVLKAVGEKIMEVKYSSHNPTIDCVCKTCVICNKLLNNLK